MFELLIRWIVIAFRAAYGRYSNDELKASWWSPNLVVIFAAWFSLSRTKVQCHLENGHKSQDTPIPSPLPLSPQGDSFQSYLTPLNISNTSPIALPNTIERHQMCSFSSFSNTKRRCSLRMKLRIMRADSLKTPALNSLSEPSQLKLDIHFRKITLYYWRWKGSLWSKRCCALGKSKWWIYS